MAAQFATRDFTTILNADDKIDPTALEQMFAPRRSAQAL
jgi:hypothetical protein